MNTPLTLSQVAGIAEQLKHSKSTLALSLLANARSSAMTVAAFRSDHDAMITEAIALATTLRDLLADFDINLLDLDELQAANESELEPEVA